MNEHQKYLFFTFNLIKWDNELNNRPMPWKGEKDPYKIWLSEIILQQTRVEQGMDYYKKFLVAYPTVEALALAPEKDVFKLWEGLGYYSRCKNLIATAKYIQKELCGVFPNNYDSLLKLKGIGPYTASAISSFAYDLPHAVLDGNVMRVLSRFFGSRTPIDSSEGKIFFTSLANRLLDKCKPAQYNQAIMDLGATVCKPQVPICSACLLSDTCVAFNTDTVGEYPVKIKKLQKRSRWFYYLVVQYNNHFYIRKRTAKDIWQNLHEFILYEAEKELDLKTFLDSDQLKSLISSPFELISISRKYKQQLTHQTINGYFIHIRTTAMDDQNDYKPESLQVIEKLAFPRFITGYFEDSYPFSSNKSLHL